MERQPNPYSREVVKQMSSTDPLTGRIIEAKVFVDFALYDAVGERISPEALKDSFERMFGRYEKHGLDLGLLLDAMVLDGSISFVDEADEGSYWKLTPDQIKIIEGILESGSPMISRKSKQLSHEFTNT